MSPSKVENLPEKKLEALDLKAIDVWLNIV